MNMFLNFRIKSEILLIRAYIPSLTHHPHPCNCIVLNLLHPEGLKFTKFY